MFARRGGYFVLHAGLLSEFSFDAQVYTNDLFSSQGIADYSLLPSSTAGPAAFAVCLRMPAQIG
jgi:hypothetical protein